MTFLLLGIIIHFGLPPIDGEATQNQRETDSLSPAFHLHLQPLSNPLDPLVRPDTLYGLSRVPTPLRLNTWDSEDVTFLTVSDFLYGLTLDRTYPGRLSVYTIPFGVLQSYTWVYDDDRHALQWRLSQLLLPPDSTDTMVPLSLPGDFFRPDLLRQVTVIQMHGTLRLPAKDQHALHYGLYMGTLTKDTPHSLITGAQVSYTIGFSEMTIGIDYLSSKTPLALALLTNTLPLTTPPLRGNPISVFRLPLLLEQDKHVVMTQLLRGTPKGEDTPLMIHAKPVLHLNTQWTMFYRFDHFSLGQGLAKFTEHTFGVKYLAVGSLVVQAEFLQSHCHNPSMDAEGFRLSGTFRF
jgi:hypothetical protein